MKCKYQRTNITKFNYQSNKLLRKTNIGTVWAPSSIQNGG